jgi:hypothetical protein
MNLVCHAAADAEAAAAELVVEAHSEVIAEIVAIG